MNDALLSVLVPLMIVVPIIAASILIAARPSRNMRKITMVGVQTLLIIGSVILLANVVNSQVFTMVIGGWSSAAGVVLAVDALSALMLLLTGAATLASCCFALAEGTANEPFFCPLVLVVSAGVNGALMTADLFTLFVCIEVMLLPSYGLLILAHRGMGLRMQVSSSRIYVTVNLLTSTLLLVGIAVVYSALGTVNLGLLSGRAGESSTAMFGFLLVLMALCVKAAVVPMHGWLGRTYPFMTPTVSALFASLHTKVAVYALYRLYSLFFGDNPVVRNLALVVFISSMVIGVLGAVGEKDARSILSFHMISQIGYILTALALCTPAALSAGVFYLVHNVIAKASLFLSTGAVEMAYGRHSLGHVSGLARREPLTAVVFFVAAMSLAGLPPFSGFVAKYALIAAAFSAGQWVLAIAALAVSAFTLFSMLKIWGAMFLGPSTEEEEREDPRVSLASIAPAAALALASVALGIGGQGLLGITSQIAQSLLDTQSYVTAVSS